MKITLVVVILLLLVVTLRADAGTDDLNEAIPPCTSEQIQTALNLINVPTMSISNQGQQYQDNNDTTVLVAYVHLIGRKWAVALADVPRCSAAISMATVMTRIVNENELTVLHYAIADVPGGDAHWESRDRLANWLATLSQ